MTTTWPVHGRIGGPIVMIGFGSIGQGTLPLIERHFDFDKSRFVGHRPARQGPAAPRRARHPLHPAGGDARQLPRAADAAAHRRRRPGLLRQPLGRHLLARHHGALPRARRALHRHRRRALGRASISTPAQGPDARTNYALRESVAERARAQPRRPDRRLLLRRQSRHGVVVRQAGAARPRRATLGIDGRRADDRAGLGAADAASSASRASTSPSATPSAPARRSRCDVFVNTWSVEGFVSEGMQPAELGWGTHENWMPENAQPARAGLQARDLPDAARRQHARAHLVPDARAAIRLPGHPQRVDLDRRLLHGARGRQGGLPADLPLRLSPLQRRGAVAARDVRRGRQGAGRATTSSTRTRSSTASTSSACCSTATTRTPIGTARSSRSRRRASSRPTRTPPACR